MYERYTEINIVASIFRDQSAKDYVESLGLSRV